MTSCSPRMRAVALCFALLQLVSQIAAPVADGILAREFASGPRNHVESTTAATCPVVHSPDCALCRYVAGSASKAPRAATIDWSVAVVVAPVGREAGKPALAPRNRPSERAPPVG